MAWPGTVTGKLRLPCDIVMVCMLLALGLPSVDSAMTCGEVVTPVAPDVMLTT